MINRRDVRLAVIATVLGIVASAGILPSASASVPALDGRAVPIVISAPPAVKSAAATARSYLTARAARAPKPLAGMIIALDPGHQLGNSNPRFAKYINQKRFQGRIWKICNTTGTATNSGYPEATFNWNVALILRAKLVALGAKVPMTRTSNSWNKWGPCTWDRGKFGMKVHARLMIQIHADGAPSSGHGFHIITPGLTKGWTDHIWRADLALAKAMRAGMIAAHDTPSTYIRGAINIRTDQSAMNISQIPTVTVENGNMRNRHDAALMTTRKGQEFYAAAMLRGILTYLHR
jgi:N-acetylmuramoyl-L-alanine amidase